MVNNEYNEKQLMIINGDIPMESVNGRFLYYFHKKAVLNKDMDLTQKIEDRMAALKAEAYERAKRRSNKHMRKIRHGEKIQWKQPKSNVYTNHQKAIIRGDIPCEKVHTNELISIHLKAHNNCDYELSERIYDLISERQIKEKERRAKQKKEERLRHTHRRVISKKFDSFINYGVDLPLTHFEKASLFGPNNLDNESEKRLNQTLERLKEEKKEEMLIIVKSLLLYKKDPYAFCRAKDHWEAVDMIEELLQIPIRKPQTWF